MMNRANIVPCGHVSLAEICHCFEKISINFRSNNSQLFFYKSVISKTSRFGEIPSRLNSSCGSCTLTLISSFNNF